MCARIYSVTHLWASREAITATCWSLHPAATAAPPLPGPLGSKPAGRQPCQVRDASLPHTNHSLLQEVMLMLWRAALRGDVNTVRRLLQKHQIPPDTPHPVTGLFLILELAAQAASSEDEDRRLRDVMEALAAARWTPSLQYLTGREDNALHMLSAQQPQFHIMKRVKFLVGTQAARPTAINMLNTENVDGQAPEQVAFTHRPEVGVYLYTQKLKIWKAAMAVAARTPRPAARKPSRASGDWRQA